MSLRGSEVQALLEELRTHFLNARIQDLRQPDATRLFIEVHGSEGRQRCVLDAAPGRGRFHRVDRRPANAPQPPAFLAGCRKEAQGARISDISANAEQNTLQWTLRRGEEKRHIVLQWGRTTGVLALLDETERVLVGVGRMVNGRPCTPGLPLEHPRPHPDPRPPRFPQTNGNASEEIASLYERLESEAVLAMIVRGVQRVLKKIDRRLTRIREDLDRVDQADHHQRLGELLKNELHRVKRGMKSIEVTDWYASDTPKISIPLDPRLDGSTNLGRIFHEAGRFKAARSIIENRMKSAELERSKIEELSANLASDNVDSADLLAQARKLGVIQERKERTRSGPRARIPHRTYRAFDGTAILVGRGARDNAELTFRVARGNDLWLHARNRPGAHVIIRRERGREIHPRALEEAALLAAHGAKGGAEDTTVEISWTERKHVRKVRGGAPGAVTIAGARTLLVRRDPERLRRLLDTQETEASAV